MASMHTVPPGAPAEADHPPESRAHAAELSTNGHIETEIIPETPVDSQDADHDAIVAQKTVVNGEGKPDPPIFEFHGKEETRPTHGTPNTETTPFEFTGQGEDYFPRSPIRKPGHKKSGSLRSISGVKRAAEESNKGADADLAVKRSRSRSGDRLTSVERTKDYEESLALTEKEKKPARDLVSGRRAGAGWERSGIRFAPLNIPFKRRLQMLVVLWHSISIPLFVTVFFMLCAIPLFWPLILPYLLLLLFSSAGHDGKLSRRSEFVRGLRIWSLFASYFPARLHRSQILPPTRKYIFGYHPHGIISHGAFAAFGTSALGFSHLFPGITNTLLTLDSNFRVPLYRDYILALGLGSVSRQSCENILSKGGANGEGMGRAITIVIGGARESLDAQPGALRLVLKRRKGFVKLAIRTGADLVPVLAFGENELYEQVDGGSHKLVHKGQLLVKNVLGWTVPIFRGRGILNYDVGLMPYRKPVNVVVGRPVKVRQMKTPEDGYVDELHGLYVQELERIWEAWKEDFAGGRGSELEIVE